MYSKTNQEKINKFRKKYNLIQESPYGASYYSEGLIAWGYKPEGSYRLSDHWNFYSRGEMHCKTTCGTTNGWYVGVYNNGVYTLLEKVFTDEEMEKEKRMEARYKKKQKAIMDKQRKEEEKLKKIIDKGVNAKVHYSVSTKRGRFFNKKEYEEECFVKGCWAYTSNGRKREFIILQLIEGDKQNVEKF